MSGEPIILDLWFPVAFRGKGRPKFRSAPRKGVSYIEKELPDPKNPGEMKIAKHYALRDIRPHAYGESTTEFEAAIRLETERQIYEAKEFKIIKGSVRVDWCAYYQPVMSERSAIRASKVSGVVPFLKKPDKDNIEKLLCDAIDGLAYMDDAQIVFGTGAKIYSSREGLRAQVSQCDPLEVKRWAEKTFKWKEEDFKLEG